MVGALCVLGFVLAERYGNAIIRAGYGGQRLCHATVRRQVVVTREVQEEGAVGRVRSEDVAIAAPNRLPAHDGPTRNGGGTDRQRHLAIRVRDKGAGGVLKAAVDDQFLAEKAIAGGE